jgi:hypothetical protein
MPLVLVSAAEPEAFVRGRRAGVRDRLAARWGTGRLDRALAAGVAPEADAALELRAQALVGPAVRGALARRLEDAVHEAGAASWPGSRVVADREAVLDAADELDAVIELLRRPGPVGAAGVAQVALLLSDGLGPLYERRARPVLRAAVGAALAGLEVP